MAQLALKVNKRLVLGKEVRFLRRKGITPLHLFGHGVESLALQSDTANVEKSLRLAGETRLISLTVDNERRPRPVLVKGVERDAVSGKLLHVDLYQVAMGEKVTVDVPIVLVGDARALLIKGSTVMQQLDSVTVECLPDRIPESVKLDVTALAEPGQTMRIKDIAVDADVTVVNDAAQIVAVVVARPEEQARPVEKAVAEEPKATPSEAGPAGEGKEASQ